MVMVILSLHPLLLHQVITKFKSNHISQRGNILLKVQLQVMSIQLVALLERNFSYTLFSGNFQSNFSSRFLLVAGSERLDSTASLSKTRKTTTYQKKTFAHVLQNGCSEKHFFEEYSELFGGTLFDKIGLTTWKGCLFV